MFQASKIWGKESQGSRRGNGKGGKEDRMRVSSGVRMWGACTGKCNSNRIVEKSKTAEKRNLRKWLTVHNGMRIMMI